MRHGLRFLAVAASLMFWEHFAAASEPPGTLPPVNQRFAAAEGGEVPSFQRHVVTLFGRLGCNGRACHGSFQGRGGFCLSLFGYDFQADHDALFAKDSPRVDVDDPDESLIIAKPTDEDMHEGGQRYAKGGWEYHLLRRWIAAGAAGVEQPLRLERLQVTPAEIDFDRSGQQVQLRAVAVWADGTREDVTPLCRFQTNDELVAEVDGEGCVTSGQAGDTHVVVSYDSGVTAVPVIRPVSELAGAKFPAVPTPTRIDELVVARLQRLGIVPSGLCSDAEFLRRVSLDLTGTLPSPADVTAFLEDMSADKRSRKIDQLLETPAYAAWWTTRLCDYTGNSDDLLVNVSPARNAASQEWYDWIHRRVAENMPYDELVAGIVTAASRQPGQSYLDYCREMSDLYREGSEGEFADLPGLTHYWARRDFREADARAIAFAYSFLGIRIQCAQCHKHPFDQWSKDDFDDFKTFFAGVVANQRAGSSPEAKQEYDQLVRQLGLKDKRGNDLRKEIPALLKAGKTIPFPEVYVSAPRGGTGQNRDQKAPQSLARLLGGEEVDLGSLADPRQFVMDWLRGKDNRFFAPAFVNRVWASYFNVGIVDPPDDLSLANPPSNGPLLEYLARGFVESGFDMQWVHREIANSRTYQLSWEPNETNAKDERNFSRAVPRRLPAEVIYDAVQLATSSDEQIARLHRTVAGRAIAVPGAGARNSRAGSAGYALTVFGRSTRESNCDCDRSSESSLLQTVYLHNDQELLQKLGNRSGTWMDQVARELGSAQPPQEADEAAAGKQLKSLQAQHAQITARLQKLKKLSGDAAAGARMAARAQELQQQIRRLEPAGKPAAPRAESAPQETVRDLIGRTYLRTVSRYPDETEMARAETYVRESPTPVDGFRDLLWALLNSKEFIVNH